MGSHQFAGEVGTVGGKAGEEAGEGAEGHGRGCGRLGFLFLISARHSLRGFINSITEKLWQNRHREIQ
jgi:hypothetical protein